MSITAVESKAEGTKNINPGVFGGRTLFEGTEKLYYLEQFVGLFGLERSHVLRSQVTLCFRSKLFLEIAY